MKTLKNRLFVSAEDDSANGLTGLPKSPGPQWFTLRDRRPQKLNEFFRPSQSTPRYPSPPFFLYRYFLPGVTAAILLL